MVFGETEAEREPMQSEVMLTPAERDALRKARLIDVEPATPRRGKRISLTDAGWAWAAENMNAELPDTPAARVLRTVLGLLDKHLDAHHEGLAHFVSLLAKSPANQQMARKKRRSAKKSRQANKADGAKQKSVGKNPRANVAVAQPKRTRQAARKAPLPRSAPRAKRPPASLEAKPNIPLAERIRTTALEIAQGATRTRVRLRDLRARLPDVTRADLDRELLELQRRHVLVLYRIDDPTDISREDESAAMIVADNPRHILYLEQ
jgi:hypothetical protein